MANNRQRFPFRLMEVPPKKSETFRRTMDADRVGFLDAETMDASWSGVTANFLRRSNSRRVAPYLHKI